MASTPFVFYFRVPFDDADPAGISFFANVYRYHHQAYEAWVDDHLKLSYRDWFLSETLAIPLRKTEAEYSAPLFPGERYKLELELGEIGTSSFTLASTIGPALGGKVCAKVRTVHVFMDPRSKTKIEIPKQIRELFLSLGPTDG